MIERRATKAAGEYDRDTHVAGALRRAAELGVVYRAGQAVRYLVTDDGARKPEHGARLHFELDDGPDGAGYDDDYERELVRAAASVVPPLGWDRADVRDRLRDRDEPSLAAWG